MKFLSITGPKADIDRVVNQYLSKYEIHLENALSELKTVEELRPFMEINPYKELRNKANEFVGQLSQPVSEETGSMDVDTAVKTIQELSEYAANFQEKRTELSKKHEELLSSLQWIEPFLMENPEGEEHNGELKVTVRPYEIRTFRVTPKK